MVAESKELTFNDCRWLLLTMALTTACAWTLQEILEHKFKLSPKIISTKQVESMALINKRLTKRLDINGRYRIQTRGSAYFIKCVWQFVLFVTSITVFVTNSRWFMDHFIHLKKETVYYVPYLLISASIVAFFSWEVVANRYGKLQWGVLVHHWFCIGIAMAILFGRFTPFATWYGFCMVTMVFPVSFNLGFRCHFSYKYPVLTRKLFRFSYYLLAFDMVMCLGGQIYIILNSLLFHYNESIHVGFIVVMIVLMVGWLYDDIALLKSLKTFSLQKYEDADVLNDDNASVVQHMELQIVPKTSTKLQRITSKSVTSIGSMGSGTPTTPTTPSTPTTPNTPNKPTTPGSNHETCIVKQ